MRLGVAHQLIIVGQLLAAQPTVVDRRAGRRVNPHMRVQAEFRCKAFAAFQARECLFTTVGAQVHNEMVRLGKHFVALRAFILAFGVVGLGVVLQVIARGEAFAAMFASEGALAGMQHHVLHQRVLHGEPLVAHTAHVVSLACVHTLVLTELAARERDVWAKLAAEGAVFGGEHVGGLGGGRRGVGRRHEGLHRHLLGLAVLGGDGGSVLLSRSAVPNMEEPGHLHGGRFRAGAGDLAFWLAFGLGDGDYMFARTIRLLLLDDGDLHAIQQGLRPDLRRREKHISTHQLKLKVSFNEVALSTRQNF